MSTEDRIERARLLYERAVFDGDADALALSDRELDEVAADLALAGAGSPAQSVADKRPPPPAPSSPPLSRRVARH